MVNKKNHGFTLIELLVVIAIIGMLSSVIIVSLSSARAKARISVRIANLKTIQTALERYYSDNGFYPGSGASTWKSECAAWGNASDSNSLIPGLVPAYLPEIPADPSMNKAGNQNCLVYIYTGGASGSTDYKLMDLALTDETAADFAKYPSMREPVHTDLFGTGTAGAWSVYSPGGAGF